MMEIRTDTMAKELGLPVPIVPKERVWSDKNICGFYSSQDGNKYNFKTDGIVSRKKSNGNEAREDGEYALMNNGENDILTIRFKEEERTGPIVFDDGIFFFYDGNEGERTVFSRIKPVKSLR